MPTKLQLHLIRFSQDDETQTIDDTFMRNFWKRVESIQILPDGTSIQQQQECNRQSPILHYVKNRDRMLALASCLLKSQVYHHIVKSSRQCHARAVVELPRSHYNKPYIPATPELLKNPRYDAFSVSHQWPFAGVAYYNVIPSNTELIQVGFDIVVFDPPNEKLYNSTLEFVEVFHDQFTPREWQRIYDCQKKFGDDIFLREFYLQWAVKEAYTKALGLGMNINFADFETEFQSNGLWKEGVDDGLWRWVKSNNGNEPLPLKGTIIDGSVDRCSPSTHVWQFFFLPLFEFDQNELQNKTCMGCGCVCVGPLPSDECSVENTDIQTKWTSTNNLIEWHYHHDDQMPIGISNQE